MSAREAIARNPVWYHTIEVAPGVTTPGQVDLRPVAPRVLPDGLQDLRALDVGTFDGFWAFEMERRGAEVVALDLPSLADFHFPPRNRERLEAALAASGVELGRGFRIAHELLDSRVTRVEQSVTDVALEDVGGAVDLVFMGALLIHLRDPVGALERLHAVLKPGGRIISLEPFSIRHTLTHPRSSAAAFLANETDFNWWAANLRCLRSWIELAGFDDVGVRRLHRIRGLNPRMHGTYASLSGRRT